MPPPNELQIPYRCKTCHALLVRVPPPHELAAAVDRHSYTCSTCGQMTPARDIEAGQLDVKETVPSVAQLSGTPPYALKELIGYLRGQHTEGFFYRGQTQWWPGPLLPSLYRGTTRPDPVDVPGHYRLRELGTTFCAVDPTLKKDGLADLVKRSQFNAYLFQVFGYPFGSILAQQCNLTSEALDVSHNLDVATFFAIYDPPTNAFLNHGTGVIYRIAAAKASAGNRDYSTASFFDCSSLISAINTFYQLRRCSSWNEAVATFRDYFHQLAATRGLDPELPRPLGLLGVPADDLIRCRIVQQQAALLLPDVVLPQTWKLTTKQPPPGKAEWNGPLLVEDLSTREGVECFEFCHSPKGKYLVPRSPQVLFPAEDGVTKLLRLFLAATPETAFITEREPQGATHTNLIE